MEKSQVSKVPCFDEISGNLDPIWVESISPSFKNSYRPIQVIYSGRLEIFPWNLVTSSNGMAMKQLYKGLFRYLDKLYGYVWICMDKRYLRSNWIWYCKNGKTKAEYSEYLCVAETKAVHLGLKRIAIACKMGVSKLGDP